MKKKTDKKDKDYMAILDQPIGELKKPMGQSVNFDKAISQSLKNNGKNKAQK